MPTDALGNPGECILLVDDEAPMLRSLERALRAEGFRNIVTCQDALEVESLTGEHDVAVILLDLLMPRLGGEELLARLAAAAPGTPVIIVTAMDQVDTAVRCIKKGAFDYLVKPVDFPRLIATVERALQQRRLKAENQELKRRLTAAGPQRPECFERILTQSPALLAVFRYVEAVAASPEPVLVAGETGVGKELVAEALHRASGRAGGLVFVNIAAIDGTAFADTLFGHLKGSFTGADRAREGLIERAAGGTLVLDEIGELDPEMQTKLLRLIEEREFLPLGSDAPRRSECRVVAVTNRDLRARIREGRFREDLFYRLHAHLVRVPPLRERLEDLPLLLDRFLRDAAASLGKAVPTPPKELLTHLSAYAFPGNVRELRSMVVDAVASHEKGVLSLSTFLDHMDEAEHRAAAAGARLSGGGESVAFGPDLPTLREASGRLFEEALRRAGGNQAVAARMLGVSRRTISRYVTSGVLQERGGTRSDEVEGGENP